MYFSYINGEHTTKVWSISETGEELALVRKFLKFCFDESERMAIDPRIRQSITTLNEMQNPPPGFDKEEIAFLKNYLQKNLVLPTYGFNSSRYDLQILFAHMIQIADEMKMKRSEIQLIKKGAQYFSINLGPLHLKDIMNFTCPMSLDMYLKTWSRDFSKLCYPYEYFESIDAIRSQIEFPSVDAFTTVLKGKVDGEVYEKCKNEYNRRLNLPSGHPDKWHSFEDYLKYYNQSDVVPASIALLNQFKVYNENFGIYPNSYLGLPSFSKDAMFKLYNEKSPKIFTFHQLETNNLFRESIVGGLTACFKRHVTLDENEQGAYRAKYSKRDKKWKKIEFYDINSMYPATYKERFPVGVGFEWSLSFRGKLSKKLMTKRKISLESLQWLDFMEQEQLN